MAADEDTERVAAAEQRREHMLRAALEVIGERGFPETRIADVADRAGTSPALVIYYFATKDNLLLEAARYAEESWYDLGARRMASVERAADRLEAIVAMTCLPEVDREEAEPWSLWLDLWALALRHPEAAAVREEFDADWRSTIAEIVREGQRSGEFEAIDANDFAVTFSALLDGLVVQTALGDPAVDPQWAFDIGVGFASATLGFARMPARTGGGGSGRTGVGRKQGGRRKGTGR